MPLRILRGLAYAVAAVVVVVEDWVWEVVGALSRALGRLALVRRIETALASATPAVALIAFAIPLLLVEPAKLWGLALLAQGRAGAGATVLALAYGVGTALLARVWTVCKPALIRYRAIAWSVAWLDWFRAAIMAWLNARPAWRRLTALRGALKQWAQDLLRRFYRR